MLPMTNQSPHDSGSERYAEPPQESALQQRKLIEQAQGVMMRNLHLSHAESLIRLQRLARDQRANLVDVAKTILKSEAGAD